MVTLNFTANDGTQNSNTAVATIDLPPSLDLDNVASGTGFITGWYNSGTNAGGTVPITNMTNAPVKSNSGLANLTGMTVTLASFHAGDVLALATLPTLWGEYFVQLLQRHLEPDRQRHLGPLPASACGSSATTTPRGPDRA